MDVRFSVESWWTFLRTVAALNILVWSFSAVTFKRRFVLSDESYNAHRLQLWLSAGYVFGCAFRSLFPVYDIPRIGLFDSWLSSVSVGRSIATFAELCFAAQWAAMLRETARITGSIVAKEISRAIVPLIAIAELCSWYAVLTTANLGHVAENSIWGLSAALVVVGMMAIRPLCTAQWRTLLAVWCVAGAAFVAYIFLVDVPMYWSRWMADEASAHRYLSLAQGVLDASTRRIISFRWEDWKSEVTWMSLYFSVGVWVSISLIHAQPRMQMSAEWISDKKDPITRASKANWPKDT